MTKALESWAAASGVVMKFHRELPRVHTVAEAAEVLGVETAAVAKSVVFDHGGAPLVVLAPGDAKVRDRSVLDHVGGVRNALRLASGAQVLAWTGYPPGGVPPFGHPQRIRTLMDERLLALESVVFGGGDDATLIEVSPAEVRRVTSAEMGRFVA